MTDIVDNQPKNKGGRPRKGTLQFRGRTWYAVLTVTIDGEALRKWVNLETDNKAVARRKLTRLMKDHNEVDSVDEVCEAAKAPETYAELADRVAATRRTSGIADTRSEELRERIWILPEIGQLPVESIRAEHIRGIFDKSRVAGKSLSHMRNLRMILRSRFSVAIEEELIQSSPVARVAIPKMKVDRRERAVVNDTELAVYLAWTPDTKNKRFLLGVRERQTMSALARMFGGLRTGDLHALQWTYFDAVEDGFTWGVAPRKKTARPQRINIPDSLRPILQDWWERAGRPSTGFVFPALRGERAGVGEKKRVSHAEGLRRDMQRAFLAFRKAYAEALPEQLDLIVPGEGQPRWKELFEQTEFTRPVDFHSWRRRFVQALEDAGVNLQTSQKLAGHADLSAHERYLRTTSKTLTIPDAALPTFEVSLKPSTKLLNSATQSSFTLSQLRDLNSRPAVYESLVV